MNEQALFDLELKVLLEALYQRYHYDFRSYAVSSLRRRVSQAMQRYECERLSDLQHRLLHEPELFAQAMQFFTVQVSEMFRDPEYFRQMREQVVPVLRTYPSVKLWVAGCSTGEEVWSLAILLHEEGLLERSIVYATDINPAALATAEAGAFCIVIEGVAESLAREITEALDVPTIGIGASAACDGQVLVVNDMLGMFDWTPKFVRKYADLRTEIDRAAAAFASDVKTRRFPAEVETYFSKKPVAS